VNALGDRLPAWLLVVGLIPGAHSSAATPASTATPPAPCVVSRAELKAHDLADIFLHRKGELELRGASLGCLKLENGMELPALLLALPPFESPYAIRLSAPTKKGTYVQPRVDMLDAQYATARSFGADRVKRRAQEVSLEVFMDPPNATERFLLLYPDPEHLAEKSQQTTSQTNATFVGTGFWISGSDKTTVLESTTEGKLTVQLIGDQWDKALKAAQSSSHH